MAAKRRAVSPDSEGESSSKRARTTEDSDEQPTRSQRRRGRDKPEDDRVELEDDEAEEMEQTEPNEDDEIRFEEEHEEEIRAKVIGGNKVQGNIAEMGIIEKLELHQFMCHKYLEFTFGPQINFIIGGKSAVLSALTVALGGKANVTGRGSGLKSFIREGQGAAEVTVTLKNQGEDAYKYKEYGDSIVVTRRFTKEGSSSYKIKSKSGKVISTKRDELSAICDHMNIQVDNPMNILTQGQLLFRLQFLSASQPADKYRFFLRGTQLSQLSEEYSTCMENISQTQKILTSKSEMIPDLQQALKDAVRRLEEAEKAVEQQRKVNELKSELAWTHVAVKEKDLRTKLEAVAKCERNMKKIQEELDKAEKALHSAEEAVTQREAELGSLGDIQDLHVKRREKNDAVRANVKRISEVKGEERTMNDSMKALNLQIESLKQKITEEEIRMAEFTQGKRDEIRRKLDDANTELKEAEDRLNEIKAELPRRETESKDARAKLGQLKEKGDEVKRKIMNIKHQLQLVNEGEKNQLAPFGNKMEAVLTEISRTQWYGRQPVGPFGRYVKVRDPDAWAPIMRVQLGHAMSAFAVTDARDRRTLEQILKQHNNKPNIFISEVDIFDYSRGEPPEQYLTVLRALEVSDEYVLRLLINSSSIERILIAKTRADADSMLMQLGNGGVAWTADSYLVTRFPEGGGRSSLLQRIDRNSTDPRLQLFTSGNLQGERRRWEQELEQAEREYREMGDEAKSLKIAADTADKTFQSLKVSFTQATQRFREIKHKRDALQDEANVETPVGISTLQDALKEAEDEKELTKKQFAQAEQKIAEINELQHPLMEELAVLKKEIDDFEGRRNQTTKLIEAAVGQRLQAQGSKTHYEKKLVEEQVKLDNAKNYADIVQDELVDWTKAAEMINSTRVETRRTVEEVERNLKSVKAALEEQEKRQGASVETIVEEVNKRKSALENARKELKMMVSLNKSLRKSIKVRLARWHEFRRHIALRCKIYFSYHLSNRGYFGKVLFDHVNGSLQLKVQTDDLAGTQGGGNREKDPRSLSGGEKSFSTICLLLSLWESIGCPIRCLDEFDVFMDAVNRRISMRMMIDTANASDRKQYILITPQDMTNITIGKTVRVHRMTDPERGQGVLAFT
ncbi:hypothetical protein PHLCEN_2v12180 [Hermanssonia centrifuga]|uniref:RecF/RecN/SMC N-terminal domain-containing protein n=1 Tax=Hermanssonia centrifuga TaxID=98765 RepID=A0A2R6NHY2_9APHY|nr:hypothetical protein PHLCEN_2v12180 [Hermanssonia centrifuga]